MNNPTVVDKVVEVIIPFLEAKLKTNHAKPIVVGIEGPQGSGKTYASLKIKNILSDIYKTCNIIQFSMDDFYLTYEQQLEVNSKFSTNLLLQGRGLPGTHDVSLLNNVFSHLIANDSSRYPIPIPIYDKSAHNGKGDRSTESQIINKPVDIIIFEGWFNGYVPISDNEILIKKWNSIRKKYSPKFNSIDNDSIIEINENLENYQKIWNMFNIFICIKTDNIDNVYKWRIQQEHELIHIKGNGMSDLDVEKFVDKYMPIYYLYYDNLSLIENEFRSLELNIDENRSLLSFKEHDLALIKN